MKKTELTFLEGFDRTRFNEAQKQGKVQMAFDWDKAAEIIKERLKTNPCLVAEAGLQLDWDHTGGVIFIDGKPTNDSYTFLSSNWAIPTLIIDNEEFECFVEENERLHSSTKWDKESLDILGIKIH